MARVGRAGMHPRRRGTRFATVGDNTIDQYVGAEQASFVGGNSVNVAIRLAELGEDVAYFGAVGHDEHGALVRQALASRGVGTDGLVERPGATSTSRIEVAPDGERSITDEAPGASGEYRPLAAELDVVAARGVAHIGWTPHGAWIRSELRARGVFLTQDCAMTPGYEHLDIAFCSAGEERAVAEALAIEAVDGGARLAVVTRGAEGSLAFDGVRWWWQQAEPTQVVDTTGAGDSFIAGFLAVVGHGGSMETALAAGASAAAETCRHRGGFRQDPIVEVDA